MLTPFSLPNYKRIATVTKFILSILFLPTSKNRPYTYGNLATLYLPISRRMATVTRIMLATVKIASPLKKNILKSHGHISNIIVLFNICQMDNNLLVLD
jgi:hypothetical protein